MMYSNNAYTGAFLCRRFTMIYFSIAKYHIRTVFAAL
jgi:hypothetical protein